MKTETASELNLIGAGTVLEGKIKSPSSVRIDGKVVGEVVAAQGVAIGATGDVEGNISAKNISVGGKVRGGMMAQEKLVLESKASVRGDIRAAKLVIDEGAVFDGKCVMSETKAVPNLVELKPEARRAEDR